MKLKRVSGKIACSLFFILIGCATSTNVNKKDDGKLNQIENNIQQEEEIKMGTLNHLTYYSEFCGMQRNVNIMLPADYDDSKKYPVIYFLHGIFGNEYSMTSDPELKKLIGKIYGQGKEMIIVFPDMFARKDFNQQPGFDQAAVDCYDNFIHDLAGDLMPFIKKTFSVLEGRENTAICGFSMGGRESLFIGLTRPDLFGYVGAFAPAPGLVAGKDYAMNHVGQLKNEELTFEGKEKPFYLQVCCGTDDTVVGQFPKSYHNIFEANDVEHTWFEIIGAGHDGRIINPGFEKFAGELFK